MYHKKIKGIKNHYILMLLLLLSTKIFGQVSEVTFMDTNYVKKYILEHAINYDLDIIARKNGFWKIDNNDNNKITSLYSNLNQKLIFQFIEYKDSCILEKHYYSNNKLEHLLSYSIFITIDSMQRGDDDHPLVPVIFIVELKQKNGIYEAYYQNGNLKQTGNYYSHGSRFDELKDGIWKEYYENGQLKSVCNYTRKSEICILEGKYLEYFNNGRKKTIGNYSTNSINKLYIDSIWGIHIDTKIWTGSQKHGTWKEYNEQGKLIKKKIYKNGELVEEKKKEIEKG